MNAVPRLINDRIAEFILSGVSRLDCVITAFGCVMMDLDDNPENDDASAVQAILYLYQTLRDEAQNIRGSVGIAQDQNSPVACLLTGGRSKDDGEIAA